MQDVFSVTIVIFTVENLAAMGLELNLQDSLITPGSQNGDRP